MTSNLKSSMIITLIGLDDLRWWDDGGVSLGIPKDVVDGVFWICWCEDFDVLDVLV